MGSITIHNLSPAMKERLRVRAAQRGHSMEAEARTILQCALERPAPAASLSGIMQELFGPEHGVELESPQREFGRAPPGFE